MFGFLVGENPDVGCDAGVEEGLASGLCQCGRLVGNTCFVELFLHRLDIVVLLFEQAIEATNHRHGQNHVPVLPPHVDVPEDIIRDPPDKVDDGVLL